MGGCESGVTLKLKRVGALSLGFGRRYSNEYSVSRIPPCASRFSCPLTSVVDVSRRSDVIVTCSTWARGEQVEVGSYVVERCKDFETRVVWQRVQLDVVVVAETEREERVIEVFELRRNPGPFHPSLPSELPNLYGADRMVCASVIHVGQPVHGLVAEVIPVVGNQERFRSGRCWWSPSHRQNGELHASDPTTVMPSIARSSQEDARPDRSMAGRLLVATYSSCEVVISDAFGSAGPDATASLPRAGVHDRRIVGTPPMGQKRCLRGH